MDSNGVQFYRCVLCRSVVSPWDISKHHGCPTCGHTRISPSSLTFWEKVVQIAKHPMVWKWQG